MLQCQLFGVHDAYRPSVSAAVGSGDGNPTVGEATEFYLGVDPTDSALVGSYRYNAVFIPEVRWHLGIVIGLFKLGDRSSYDRIREHQDDLMSILQAESEEDVNDDEVPPFTVAMVKVIIDEGLDLFFGSELGRVVCIFLLLQIVTLIVGACSQSWPVQQGNINQLEGRSLGNVLGLASQRSCYHESPLLLWILGLPQISADVTVKGNPPHKVYYPMWPFTLPIQCSYPFYFLVSGNDSSNGGMQGSDDGDDSHTKANTTMIVDAPDEVIPRDLGEDDMRPPFDQGVEDGIEEQPVAGGEKSRIDCSMTEEHLWLPPNLEASCAWDSINYSCAFDVVFMVFYLIYGQSNHIWRSIWRAESPNWNVPLGNLSDRILSTTTADDSSQKSSSLFSDCRDEFRRQITESNPTIFPGGQHFSPVVDILKRILGGTSAEPVAHQDLICGDCHVTRTHRFSVSYLGDLQYFTQLHHSEDPPIMSLELLLARFTKRFKTEPGQSNQECTSCHST